MRNIIFNKDDPFNYIEVFNCGIKWLQDAIECNISDDPRFLKDKEYYKELLDWIMTKSWAESRRYMQDLDKIDCNKRD